MKNKKLENRSYICEVRATQTENGHTITGRPIVYGSRTDIGPFTAAHWTATTVMEEIS